MLRMPYPDMNHLAPELKVRLDERLPLNIYRMLCNAPTFFPGWMDLGRAVLYQARLDPQLRELAILRVGYLSESAYETHQHCKIAAAVGLTQEKIEGTRQAVDAGVYNEREQLVLRLTEQVLRDVRADDETFAACVAGLGSQETMELLITIGFYMMVVRLIENTGIEIESGGGPSPEEVKRARKQTLARLAEGNTTAEPSLRANPKSAGDTA